MEHNLHSSVKEISMRFALLIFVLFIKSVLFGYDLSGAWQGVMYTNGQKMEQGGILYVYINGKEGKVDGLMRDEQFESEYFAIKQTQFEVNENDVDFKQTVISKSKKSSSLKWCRMDGKLVYDEAKGYLKGNFVSSDCKRVMGTIILYKSDFILKQEEQHEVSQIWFPRFLKDYNEGLSAPLIREIERKNFVFVPVYFDYDHSEIRPEHFDFLNRMIQVIKGHSDLRVKIVGHTDADGSDAYNDELSKRRAAAIINYFVAKGIAEDRLEFDFKGERNPVSNNDTPEGKQLNRRVDFSFI
jgi:outer membrane protein OmpA-like peptidoglycan-associated protein